LDHPAYLTLWPERFRRFLAGELVAYSDVPSAGGEPVYRYGTVLKDERDSYEALGRLTVQKDRSNRVSMLSSDVYAFATHVTGAASAANAISLDNFVAGGMSEPAAAAGRPAGTSATPLPLPKASAAGRNLVSSVASASTAALPAGSPLTNELSTWRYRCCNRVVLELRCLRRVLSGTVHQSPHSQRIKRIW